MSKMQLSTPTDTTILLERTFDAPRTLIWRTLTEPELVKQWWGCFAGQMTRCEIDLRIGGKWRFELSMEDGRTMGQSGEYIEISKPERIVLTEGMDGYEGSILVTYTLVEANGQTMFTCLSECHTKVIRDTILSTGMEHGATAGYDRLEQVARALL
jgi:uncharacterized protein YndB with AHSA1/START domain